MTPHIARETILATGGLGQVYLHTTNPPGARGDGFAMARRAGARLLNLEYIQFHPTALLHPKGRLLLTEALRGEGAKITDASGRPFLQDVHPAAELAPRDVVARAIHQRMLEKDEPYALLDISHKSADWIRERFPGLHRRCLELGFDLTAGPVPVVPAAHYACGGVAVDGNGRTTLGHFRAVGEVSCTGVHGANRLASTSLLEGLLWGWRAGRASAQEALQMRSRPLPEARPWQPEHEPVDPALIAQDWMVIRHTMWNYVGLLRSERRLIGPAGFWASCAKRSRTSTAEARCPTRSWGSATASRRRWRSTAPPRTTVSRGVPTTASTGEIPRESRESRV